MNCGNKYRMSPIEALATLLGHRHRELHLVRRMGGFAEEATEAVSAPAAHRGAASDAQTRSTESHHRENCRSRHPESTAWDDWHEALRIVSPNLAITCLRVRP